MRINHNINALSVYRNYTKNLNMVNKSMQRLSSGLRINGASDDAAGLAISERMRAQLNGTQVAARNCQDAISLVQTAEGALGEAQSILQRMNELAVQAASDTNDDTDRAALQEEFDQLRQELNDISNQTKFNGKAVLSGDFGGISASSSGFAPGITASVGSSASAGTYTVPAVNNWVAGSPVSGSGTVIYTSHENGIVSGFLQGSITPGSAYNGSYYLLAQGSSLSSMTFSIKDAGGATKAATAELSLSAGNTYTLDFGSYGKVGITLGGSVTATAMTTLYDGTASGFTYRIKDGSETNPTATIGGQPVSWRDTAVTIAGGVTLDLSSLTKSDWESQDALNAALFDGTGGPATVDVSEKPGIIIQTGPEAGQTLTIRIGNMSPDEMGITDDVSIGTREDAQNAIGVIKDAIDSVSDQRATLGAYQNRLEHKINNLNTAAENLAAAESRIRDADMAKEMVQYAKYNILVQVAQAMLAQANAQPQGVLQLLQ